jgi:transposase
VVEEITAAGHVAHLAEPADTMGQRGRKRHAKTDRTDSGLLRQLLQDGDLPESWIPPSDRLGVARAGALVQGAGRSELPWV